MTKNHLKRINTPSTWQIHRKQETFIARPLPGQSSFEHGITLQTVLRDVLQFADNAREVRFILQHNEVLVDTLRRKEPHYLCGIYSIISFPTIKKHFRVVINGKGKLDIVEITEKEASLKVFKVTGKTMVNGKKQLNLSHGMNLLIDKGDYKTGDGVVVDLAKKAVVEHLPLQKNSSIVLVGGKHMGAQGKVSDIVDRKITFTTQKGDVYETLRKYAYCIGSDKAAITVQ